MLKEIEFPYLETFTNFGWDILLGLRGTYSDLLPKEFYSSLIIKENGTILDYVRGTSIQLILDDIAEMFNTTTDGEMPDEEIDLLECSRIVYKNPYLTAPILRTTQLGFHERILQLIIDGNIMSKTGGRSHMAKEELWQMKAIMQGQRPSNSVIILEQMAEICTNPRRHL